MTKIIFLLLSIVAPLAAKTIAIQPLGPVPTAYTNRVTTALEASFDSVSVIILPTKELPRKSYYKPRNRYRAEIILDWLDKQQYSKRIHKVIAITEKDISTTKGSIHDWGIFGLGTIDGLSSVISTFRLKRGVSKGRLLERIRKLAIHEVGHTYGINHCPQSGCVMQDCKGSIKPVDQETGDFCSVCLQFLQQQ